MSCCCIILSCNHGLVSVTINLYQELPSLSIFASFLYIAVQGISCCFLLVLIPISRTSITLNVLTSDLLLPCFVLQYHYNAFVWAKRCLELMKRYITTMYVPYSALQLSLFLSLFCLAIILVFILILSCNIITMSLWWALRPISRAKKTTTIFLCCNLILSCNIIAMSLWETHENNNILSLLLPCSVL